MILVSIETFFMIPNRDFPAKRTYFTITLELILHRSTTYCVTMTCAFIFVYQLATKQMCCRATGLGFVLFCCYQSWFLASPPKKIPLFFFWFGAFFFCLRDFPLYTPPPRFFLFHKFSNFTPQTATKKKSPSKFPSFNSRSHPQYKYVVFLKISHFTPLLVHTSKWHTSSFSVPHTGCQDPPEDFYGKSVWGGGW